MKRCLFTAAAAAALSSSAMSAPVLAPPPPHGPDVQPYLHLPAGQIAIRHLRIIDGTGAPPVEDATLLIDGSKIGAILPAAAAGPAGYKRLHGQGEPPPPGRRGMHDPSS